MSLQTRSASNQISLEMLGDFEQYAVVNTPRSLEACYREGIDPHELLYRPPEDFYEEGLSPRIQELNYSLFEAKRKDTLQLARETRVKIVERMEKKLQKSFSEAKFSITNQYQKQIQRGKDKRIKALKQLFAYEAKAKETLLEQMEREKSRKEAEEENRKYLLMLGKTRSEQQRKLEQKAIKEAQMREKQAREKAAKLFNEQLKEEQKRRMKEIQEAKERISLQQQSEEKKKAKLQIVEQNLRMQKEALEEKLFRESMVEEHRRQFLEMQRQKMRTESQNRVRENESRHRRAVESFEKQMMARREDFYRKKTIEDKRMAKFLEEQRVAMGRMRQLSQERDQKITQTMETAAEIEEQKRERVRQKMVMNELRVQKQRQLMMEHAEFRNHITMLKQLKKDWNMRRKERKEDHLRSLSEAKLKSEQQKVRKFMIAKRKMIRSRSLINRAIDLQQYRIKEALHSMAITKKWDTKVIEGLVGDSITLSEPEKERPKTVG